MFSSSSPQIPLLHEQLAQARQRIAELERELDRLRDGQHTPSQRKNDESATLLRKSKNRYRKYFNYATDAMFVIMPDRSSMSFGRFSDVNKEATLRLGYSRDELFVMTPRDIHPPADH